MSIATIVPPPNVTQNAATLAQNAPTLVIDGSGFEAASSVQLSSGNATITSATPTRLALRLTGAPSLGALTASVSAYNGTSLPVPVATIAAPPNVTQNTADRDISSTAALIITGTGFDPAGANTVVLNLGAVGSVSNATSAQLTVLVTTAPTTAGVLTAIVTSFGGTSGAAVQVANIVPTPPPPPPPLPPPPPPTVTDTPPYTYSTLNYYNYVAETAPSLYVFGTGFAPSSTVVLTTLGAVGVVTSALPNRLTVKLLTQPSLGPRPQRGGGGLRAVVTSNGMSSGAPVVVATIVKAPIPIPGTYYIAQNANSLVINGLYFDDNPGGNSIALSSGSAAVVAATPNQLGLTLVRPPALGPLTANVTSFGGQNQGGAAQVATVVPAPMVTPSTFNWAQNTNTLTIAGSGFDSSGTSVVLSSGSATFASATPTKLVLTMTTPPALGPLTVSVVSFGGSSGAPVQVASVFPAPRVTVRTVDQAQNAPELTVYGTDFASPPSANQVSLTLGAAGTVTAGSATQLTVKLTKYPSTLGALSIIVTSNGAPSAPARVATVVYPPKVTGNTANVAQNARTLVISGSGFDPSGGNTVLLSGGATGTVASVTGTQLIVSLTTAPTVAGPLTAVVTAQGGNSGVPVPVATVTLIAAAAAVTGFNQVTPTMYAISFLTTNAGAPSVPYRSFCVPSGGGSPPCSSNAGGLVTGPLTPASVGSNVVSTGLLQANVRYDCYVQTNVVGSDSTCSTTPASFITAPKPSSPARNFVITDTWLNPVRTIRATWSPAETPGNPPERYSIVCYSGSIGFSGQPFYNTGLCNARQLGTYTPTGFTSGYIQLYGSSVGAYQQLVCGVQSTSTNAAGTVRVCDDAGRRFYNVDENRVY